MPASHGQDRLSVQISTRMSSTPLVTRFAPSPTGPLHLGNARTALLNYLAARNSGGRFILRVDDTDDARSSDGLIHDLLDDLRWLGLEWDEGPDVGGPHSAYRQHQRRAIYEEWLAKLDAAGLTYPCFCTTTQLNASRRQQVAAGKHPRYAGTCRSLTEAQRCERLVRGQAAALRFKVPAGGIVTFVDVVAGEQCFTSDDIGDFIVRRADGATAFFFSNAIDDALMGVSLVLRGDDHLANTPRQLLILDALNLPAPLYAHIALLVGMDGAPLSTRHCDVSLQELRRRGFFATAIRNYLVRLGHSCKTSEWLDDKALIAQFDLARLERAPAQFDGAQLRHWQDQALARVSHEPGPTGASEQLSADEAQTRQAAARRGAE
jgi:glutamyl-tRNA synthetase